MTLCREEERLKGGSYPKSCPTCRFGPCPNGVGDWGPKPAPEAPRKASKAFVVSTAIHAEALRRRLPDDWYVVHIGGLLAGHRFDDVVIAEDYSRPEYASETWLMQRREWYDLLKMRMNPDADGLRLTHPPG